MLRTKTWIYIISVIFLLSAGSALLIYTRPAGSVVNIYLDGELVRTVDLSKVDGAESFVLRSERGENTVLIENGRIRVADADCPDRVCVDSGWLTGSAPIVCLPHRLVIEFSEKSGGVDAVAG